MNTTPRAEFEAQREALTQALHQNEFQRALAACKNPTLPTNWRAIFLNDTATAYSQRGDHESAATLLQQAYGLNQSPALLRNFAEALKRLGQPEQALSELLQAIENIRTTDQETQKQLSAQKYIEIARTLPDPWRTAQALAKLIELLPSEPEAHRHRALALERAECDSEAIDSWTRVIQHRPGDAMALARRALTLPAIMHDTEAIARDRANQTNRLTELKPVFEMHGCSALEMTEALSCANFYSAYHGENDRNIQTLHAQTLEAVAQKRRHQPMLAVTSGRKPRIGLVSALWKQHTIGHDFASWATRIDSTRFEVHVIHNGQTQDSLTQQLAKITHYHHLDGDSNLIARIEDIATDILIYPDVGMTSRNLPLTAYRLAPVQCAAWGHPVTTGFSNIDAYFSCTEMEPEDAQTHYVEPLRLLPGIGTCFTPPPLPPKLSREALGLPNEGTLLLCPQSPHKIHPDNHAPWAEILRRLPNARWVMFSSKYGRHTAELNAVLKAFDPILTERLIVLPQTSHERFLQVNLACDVMLDTLRWSGGNTSLDAIQCNLPIVTLPGRFMRGRQTLGMYKLMGLEDEVTHSVDAYIEKAVSLVQNPKKRTELSKKIAANKHKLFNDLTPIRALEDHLLQLLAEKGLKFGP